MKRYLIFLDILGFYQLPKLIAKETNIEDRKIRVDFLNVINGRIALLKDKDYILDEYNGTDNWILVTDEINKVFLSIYEILEHNTGYKNYKKIPIEIAIGTVEYDNWVKYDGKNLIVENETIEFLKTSICKRYCDWFKEIHGKSIQSTYILLTESFFEGLDSFDKHNLPEMYFDQTEDEKKYEFVAAEIDEFKKRGKILKFMEVINHSGDKQLSWLDKIYVPPLEYPEIVRTLKEKRIVFITGTPEFGKTYTAVKLLWDYYNLGYDPLWIDGEEAIDRIEVRKRFYEASDVKPGRIVYFEDPFGKTIYEKRESLEREIGMVIEGMKNVLNVYVVITSREEVFKEFEKENLSGTQLKDFEEKLNIKRPSYDDHKRNLILLNWAKAENCKWLQNNYLTSKILNLIDDDKILPTPLNIKAFTIASSNIDDEKKLNEIIKEKSKETSKAFAKEITHMAIDKILFLMFPFISERFEIGFIRVIYDELLEELNLESAWNFEKVINWFKNDKINIKDNKVQFSHSSYREAVNCFLFDDNYSHNKSSLIFGRLMIKLCQWDEIAKDVLWVVSLNFNNIPEDLRNDLLLRFNENKITMWNYSWCIAFNFDIIPASLRNMILEKIYKEYESVWSLLSIIKDHFGLVPEFLREKIIFHLSKIDEVMEDVLQILFEHFDDINEDLRNILLLKFAKNKHIQYDIIQILFEHFDEILPMDFRNKLLLNLYENRDNRHFVAIVIANYYDQLPDELRILLTDYPYLYNRFINSKFTLIGNLNYIKNYDFEKKIVTDSIKDVVFDNIDKMTISDDFANNFKEQFFNAIDEKADEIHFRMKEIRDKINHQMSVMGDKINNDENDFEFFLEEYSAVFLVSPKKNRINYKGIFHKDNYPKNEDSKDIFYYLDVYIPYMV